MRCHCSCRIYLKAARYLLIQTVQAMIGMRTSSELLCCRITVCRMLRFAIWSQHLAPSALTAMFSSVWFTVQSGGSLYIYNYWMMCACVCVCFSFFLVCFSFSSSQPGASLEQTHIFVLAHILRRPIIVYGVKYYKSFRGETLGYTRFQGEPAESFNRH